jgi:hypothetical protein
MLSRRRRLLGWLFLASLVSAVCVGTAIASTLVNYHGAAAIAPGGFYQTSGPQNRDWNASCRTGNSGQMAAQYTDGGGTVYANSGSVWTNCGLGATASLGASGGSWYAKCVNTGTVSFTVACQTTKP